MPLTETDSIYDQLLADYYTGTVGLSGDEYGRFSAEMQQGEQGALAMVDGNEAAVKTLVGDSGKTAFRFIETDDQLLILGAISEGGRVSMGDRGFLREMIARVEASAVEGKTILTSTNEHTAPLLERVARNLERGSPNREPMQVTREHMGGHDVENVGHWDTVSLSASQVKGVEVNALKDVEHTQIETVSASEQSRDGIYAELKRLVIANDPQEIEQLLQTLPQQQIDEALDDASIFREAFQPEQMESDITKQLISAYSSERLVDTLTKKTPLTEREIEWGNQYPYGNVPSYKTCCELLREDVLRNITLKGDETLDHILSCCSTDDKAHFLRSSLDSLHLLKVHFAPRFAKDPDIMWNLLDKHFTPDELTTFYLANNGEGLSDVAGHNSGLSFERRKEVLDLIPDDALYDVLSANNGHRFGEMLYPDSFSAEAQMAFLEEILSRMPEDKRGELLTMRGNVELYEEGTHENVRGDILEVRNIQDASDSIKDLVKRNIENNVESPFVVPVGKNALNKADARGSDATCAQHLYDICPKEYREKLFSTDHLKQGVALGMHLIESELGLAQFEKMLEIYPESELQKLVNTPLANGKMLFDDYGYDKQTDGAAFHKSTQMFSIAEKILDSGGALSPDALNAMANSLHYHADDHEYIQSEIKTLMNDEEFSSQVKVEGLARLHMGATFFGVSGNLYEALKGDYKLPANALISRNSGKEESMDNISAYYAGLDGQRWLSTLDDVAKIKLHNLEDNSGDFVKAFAREVIMPAIYVKLSNGHSQEAWHNTDIRDQHGDEIYRMAADTIFSHSNIMDAALLSEEWHKPHNHLPTNIRDKYVDSSWHSLFTDQDDNPYVDVEHEGQLYRLRSLNSNDELVRESQTMAHCVGKGGYEEDCRNGECHIVSIRSLELKDGEYIEERNHPKSTIEIQYDDYENYRIEQHQGPSNTSPKNSILELGGKFLEQLNSPEKTILNTASNSPLYLGEDTGETQESKRKMEESGATKTERIFGFTATIEKFTDVLQHYDKHLRFEDGRDAKTIHMHTVIGDSKIIKMPKQGKINKGEMPYYTQEAANNNVEKFMEKLDGKLSEFAQKHGYEDKGSLVNMLQESRNQPNRGDLLDAKKPLEEREPTPRGENVQVTAERGTLERETAERAVGA